MSVRILGIGNPMRGDDGAGPAAVGMLSDLPPNVELRAGTADPAALVDWLSEARRAILIDAAAPAGHPGRVRRIPWGTQAPIRSDPATSTHGFGVAEALALADAMGELPPEVVLWTIEGQSFGEGEGLSPAVAAGLPNLASNVRAEALRPETGGPPTPNAAKPPS